MSDTIFAVATGAGRAAIAVIRVSGPTTGSILDRLCSRPPPRALKLRALRAADGELLDRSMVAWLPGPRTYTGEDCAELQVHGGPAVLEGVSDALVSLGVRPAEPGEFTRRAFMNGRMDLTEAEGIADLIAAETAGQRRQALRQADGALSRLYGGWASRLLSLLAQQEALIDFPDEDLPPEVEAATLADLAALRSEMRAHADDAGRGERLRTGLVFAIVGLPNVGKSTLINALALRDVAIVSPVAGTTRDIVEAHVDLGGIPVSLLDTAGLRASCDAVETEGVRRALERAGSADLVLWLSDGTAPADELFPAARSLTVATKADLGGPVPVGAIGISALTGAGLEDLRSALVKEAQALAGLGSFPALTRARHREALVTALAHLDRAVAATTPELRGEDFRLALRALGRITGRVGVEDVLDTIFSAFCIGK